MKSILRTFLTPLILLLVMSVRTSAQHEEAVNDSLFNLVKKEINAQNGEAIYAMLSTDFQANISKEQFTGILKANLYPLGAIVETTYLGYTDNRSNYKAVCPNGVLEFRITGDKDGKIAGLRFLPYKEPVGTKDYVVPSNNPMQSHIDSAVDRIARVYMNKVNTVGMSIGIIRKGTAATYGYGSIAVNSDKIPDADAIFEIGSVTKTFTATLLAYYANEHKVGLNDAITKFLPDSVAANKDLQQVTLQMLANHTSGLPRLPDNLFTSATNMQNPYKDYDREKLYAYLKKCKIKSGSGGKYAYSNLGAGLLGSILEDVSGKSYEQMVTDIICTPLGMSSTYTHPSAMQAERQVAVHDDKGKPVVMWDMNVLAGAGAVRSTVHDMVLYVLANMQNQNGKLPEAMDLTHKLTYEKEVTVGLGWHIVKGKSTVCWHNGGTGGCSTMVTFDPAKQTGVVVLANSAESTDAVGQQILAVLQQE